MPTAQAEAQGHALTQGGTRLVSISSLYVRGCVRVCCVRSKIAVLTNFVVVQLVQLLCRTIKLGWFDHNSHRAIVDECKALMARGSQTHYQLGLRILNMLVQVRVRYTQRVRPARVRAG